MDHELREQAEGQDHQRGQLVLDKQNIKLDKYLRTITDEYEAFFLAVEKGSEKFEKSAIVIVNPRKIS